MFNNTEISNKFDQNEKIVLFEGSCLDLLKNIPDESIKLIVTSPPYNLGKEYEKVLKVEEYIKQQEKVITESNRVLSVNGSICWQVGNYVKNGEIVPLDILLYPIFQKLGLKMRNRIIWRFGHGFHCSKRFSGRYETIIWLTKSDNYTFNLDSVRVPQKYPQKKYYKGPKAGKYSCNPLGKNPGDVWEIPNVKSNHVEKTDHPCQFPIALIERLVLSLTNEDDWVLDPFLGTGTTIIAAIRHERRGAGAEVFSKYTDIAKNRIRKALKGTLKTRPMLKPIHDPNIKHQILYAKEHQEHSKQSSLFGNL